MLESASNALISELNAISPPKVTSPKKKIRSFFKREIGGTVIATSPQDTHRQQLMVMRTVYNFTKLALRK